MVVATGGAEAGEDEAGTGGVVPDDEAAGLGTSVTRGVVAGDSGAFVARAERAVFTLR